jgi:hypothetical protein
MNAPQPVAGLSDLAVNHLLIRSLRNRIDEMDDNFFRRNREAYESGLARGRHAALGWLFVGAASGFIAALAVGFVIFW